MNVSFRRFCHPIITACLAVCLQNMAYAQNTRDADLPERVSSLVANGKYAESLPELQSLAQAGNHAATYLLASYYICGKAVAFDCSNASRLFTEATRPSANMLSEDIVFNSKNEVAWINAVCEQPGFQRNLQLAQTYATEVSQDGDPYGLDALAAVHARQGNFTAAASTQTEAIHAFLASSSENTSPDQKTLEQFYKRLDLYKAGKTFGLNEKNAGENCMELP